MLGNVRECRGKMGNVREFLGMIMWKSYFQKEDRDKDRKEGMYGLFVKVCVGMLRNDRGC